MNPRQQKLFKNIVEQHLAQAKAIGSKFLVDKCKLDVSSATIRNDMAELENQGLIFQPHTSAGRIPTAKGYQYYVDNYLKDKKISPRDQRILDNIKPEIQTKDQELLLKSIAKRIADLSDAAAVVAFSKDNFYYTGISNLLRQPEFQDFNIIYDISQVVDHLDEVLENIFDKVEDTEIKIGKDNCFDHHCASVLTKVDGKLLGILGPMRMDYGRNLGLINYSKGLIA